jgi:hypothetical protein
MAKDNYESVFLLPFQKILFNELSQEISGMLPLNDYVIRGFIMRGIRKWQKNHSQPIMSLDKLDPTANLKAMAEIFDCAIKNMGNALFIHRKDEKEKILKEVFMKVLDFYEEVSSLQSLVENPDPDKLYTEVAELT